MSPTSYQLLYPATRRESAFPKRQSTVYHVRNGLSSLSACQILRCVRASNIGYTFGCLHEGLGKRFGLIDLWCRLRERGYTRCPESLYRVLKRLGALPEQSEKQPYHPKPYEQMTYPGQRVQIDVKVVPRRCIAAPELRLFQYTAIDEFSRLRYLAAYDEQSTCSSADFLKKAYAFFKKHGFTVECVQTDNGFAFTNRFAQSNRELVTLFERTAAELGIRHKLIRPYTPRHNGKVERSHREDQRRFYDSHRFYSLADFDAQAGCVSKSLPSPSYAPFTVSLSRRFPS